MAASAERELVITRIIDAQRLLVGIELSGRCRRRIASDPAGVEAVHVELGELFCAGARFRTRITLGLVAQRATQAPAAVSGLGIAHRPIILAAPVPGKLV